MDDQAGLVAGLEDLVAVELVGAEQLDPLEPGLLEQLEVAEDRPLRDRPEHERLLPARLRRRRPRPRRRRSGAAARVGAGGLEERPAVGRCHRVGSPVRDSGAGSAGQLGELGVEQFADEGGVGLAAGLLHDLAAEEALDGLGLLLAPLEVVERLGVGGEGGLDGAAIASRSETIR